MHFLMDSDRFWDIVIRAINHREIIVLVIAMLATTYLASTLIHPVLRRRMYPAERQRLVSDFLPYQSMEPQHDGRTLHLAGSVLERWYYVAGTDAYVPTNEGEMRFHRKRTEAYNAACRHNCVLNTHTFRDPKALSVDTSSYTIPTAKMLLDAIYSQRGHHFDLYTVIALSARGKDAESRLNQCENEIEQQLGDYGFRRLTFDEPDAHLRPLSLIATMVSPVTRPQPRGYNNDPATAVTADMVFFHPSQNLITYHTTDSDTPDLYESIITIRNWGDMIGEQFPIALSSLSASCVVSHLARPWLGGNAARIALALKNRKNRMMASTSSDIKGDVGNVYDQLQRNLAGLDPTDPGLGTLWEYCTVIAVRAPTLQQLKDTIKAVDGIIGSVNATPLKERRGAFKSYFLRFGQGEALKRPALFDSKQLACAVSYLTSHKGIPNSDLGPGPLIVVPTLARTSYDFIYHADGPSATQTGRQNGSMAVVGEPGSGKTLMMGLLCAANTRYPNHYNLMTDANGGMRNMTMAMGGKYIPFDGSVKIGFNPLDTDGSIPILHSRINWLRACLETNGDSELEYDLDKAIWDAHALIDDPTQRNFMNIMTTCVRPESELSNRLREWADPESPIGAAFNAPRDTLSTLFNHWVAMDFTKLYQNERLANALVRYIFDGFRHAIVAREKTATITLDESNHVLSFPAMVKSFFFGVENDRKVGINWITCWQNLQQMLDADLMERIKGAIPTYWLYPKEGVDREPYVKFGLNDEMIDFITSGGWNSKRNVLVVKNSVNSRPHAVIINTDIAYIGSRLLSLLATHMETRRRLERLMEDYPEDYVEQIVAWVAGRAHGDADFAVRDTRQLLDRIDRRAA